MWSNIIYFRLFLPLILANIFKRTVSYSFSKSVCNFADYYELYLTVRSSRDDTNIPIWETREAGFADLRSSGFQGILCINGPAFVHTKAETISEFYDDNYHKRIFFVDPAEIQVFEHECKTFNIRPPNPNKRPDHLDEDTVVTGEKIFGITLFGDSDDYRMPSKEMYYASKFAYVSSRYSVFSFKTGASFAFMVVPTGKLQSGPIPPCVITSPATSCTPCVPTVTDPCSPYHALTYNPKAYCLSIAPLRINVTFVPRPTAVDTDNTGYVCTVKEPFSDPEFGKLFTNLTNTDYKWYDCPDGDYGSIIPGSTNLNISQLIDFRIIDPQLLTNLGSPGKPPKPGYPGYPISPTNSYLPPTYGLFPYPGYYFPNDPNFPGGHGPDANNTNFANIRYDATDCSPEIPKPPDTCDNGNDKVCEYLNHVMGTARTEWHGEVRPNGLVDDSVTGDPPYAQRLEGVWRLEIMHLVEEIFIKACPQVSPLLAPAVNRIIEYYLLEALKTPTLMDIWKDNAKRPMDKWGLNNEFLQSLKICRDGINERNRLDFRRVRSLETLDKIKFYNGLLADPTTPPNTINKLVSRLQNKKYMLPFHVKVMMNGIPYDINPTKEAAEIDYDLNLAIDLHWKIVNTVNAFCTRIVPGQTSAFVPVFHANYHEDIFSFITSTWINADDSDTSNDVFRQLFGAFVYGGASRYLMACMEGAYIGSPLTPKWRQIRGVLLREERPDGAGKPMTKTNFATKLPPNGGEPVQYVSTNNVDVDE